MIIYKCDGCGKEAEHYLPVGWRYTERVVVLQAAHHACSQICQDKASGTFMEPPTKWHKKTSEYCE